MNGAVHDDVTAHIMVNDDERPAPTPTPTSTEPDGRTPTETETAGPEADRVAVGETATLVPPPFPQRHGSMPRLAFVCAAIATVLAVLGLLGWVFDVEGLRQLVPGQIGIRANSAIGLGLAGVAWMVRGRLGAAIAVVPLGLALVSLFEYASSLSVGIDELFFDAPGDVDHPGRPSVATLICIAVVSLPRVCSGGGLRLRRICQGFGVVALVLAAVALLGYLYDVRTLYRSQSATTLPLHTALGTALLGLAVLASVDGGILTWVLRGRDAGAVLMRRLLPLAVVGLPLIGLGTLVARRIGWLEGVGTSIAIVIVLCALAVGYLSWVAARRIARVDRRREATLLELTELKDDLERQVVERAGQLERHGGHIAVLEDRQRIAADLHDIVIQRLFAAGMYLQGANHPGADPDVRARVSTAVEAMDVAIKDLRQSIFELGGGRSLMPIDITTAVDEICHEASRILGFSPDVLVDDPDFEAETVRDDLLAVLRESLANVARHAAASAVDVAVRAADGQVSLTITDNGKGMGVTTHNSGTRNMAERARQRGGDCTWANVEPSGTRVHWRVPAAT
ncbi:sensor histidine kinase [Jatrophihabitans fulvus]